MYQNYPLALKFSRFVLLIMAQVKDAHALMFGSKNVLSSSLKFGGPQGNPVSVFMILILF